MKVDSNIDDVISQLKRSADRAVEQAMKELEKTAKRKQQLKKSKKFTMRIKEDMVIAE